MKTGLLGSSIILVAVLLVPVLCLAYTQAPSYPNYPISVGKETPNGEFNVYVMKDSGWQKVGSIPYDKFFRENQLSLSDYVSDAWKVRVRIEEKGGGAAHIDSVSLGGRPPLEVKDMADGLNKLSKKDFDVIDAFEKSIEVVFVSPAGDKTLRLTARIEPAVNTGIPFQFPTKNLGKTIGADSSFYTYRLGSVKGRIKMDGSTDEMKSLKPFFKEFSPSGTGHPSNYTYGWVWNDDRNLFVTIDFTGDNTMDGNKDYTKVFVKTDKGIKEFKMSESETKWGSPAFSYTDKVPYQHKIYRFQIPLQDIAGEGTKEKDDLLLAFSAYGTDAVECLHPPVSLQSAVGGGEITLIPTPSCCCFPEAQALSEAELPVQDPLYSYPLGLVRFILDCSRCRVQDGVRQQVVSIGTEAQVQFTFSGINDISQTRIRKFGPTPDDNSYHWYDFEWDATTGTGVDQKIGSSFVAHYVDGIRGDDDLNSTNWRITDQIGPGQPGAIPTMTEWGMIIFMVLAGLGSIHFLGKRRGRS